jgi:hypothetical protein
MSGVLTQTSISTTTYAAATILDMKIRTNSAKRPDLFGSSKARIAVCAVQATFLDSMQAVSMTDTDCEPLHGGLLSLITQVA